MILSAITKNALAQSALALCLPLSCLCAQTSTVLGTGCFGMSLVTSELPDVATAPFDFQVSSIPAGSVLNFLVWSDAAYIPHIDLGIIGAPGCPLFLDDPVVYATDVFPIGTTDTFTSGAPNPLIYDSALWINYATYFQAVALVPGVNSAWLVTSNAVALVGG